jgi:hypothetical protein
VKLRKIRCCRREIWQHPILCCLIRLDPRGVAREWERAMRKRLVRAVILIAIASGIAIGVGSAAGAVDLGRPMVATDGISWG